MIKINKLSDEKVVKFVREKDKESYREIIKRYQNKLMRYALYLTQDEHKAADVVQETFIKAYKNLNNFNEKRKFSSWIYRIAHNEAMNFFKKKQFKKIILNEDLDFDSGIDLQDNLIKKELQENIHHCLKKISLLYREPLTLYFLEEKSYEEISDILRIPIGTVGTRINRAKILMKKICQKLKK
jgi:RNA polymerase sigma-70 factor, ECF subfamily